jgi:predicted HicB family RNase H-like nuclease
MMKIGRPTIPAKDRASRLIALRLTPAEHKALEQAAEKAGLSVSQFIRKKLDLRGAK